MTLVVAALLGLGAGGIAVQPVARAFRGRRGAGERRRVSAAVACARNAPRRRRARAAAGGVGARPHRRRRRHRARSQRRPSQRQKADAARARRRGTTTASRSPPPRRLPAAEAAGRRGVGSPRRRGRGAVRLLRRLGGTLDRHRAPPERPALSAGRERRRASGWLSNATAGRSYRLAGRAEGPGEFVLACQCPVEPGIQRPRRSAPERGRRSEGAPVALRGGRRVRSEPRRAPALRRALRRPSLYDGADSA